MEYLKIILTHTIVSIFFNIPLFVIWIRNKDSYRLDHLKRKSKSQLAFLLARLLSRITSIYLLKLDAQVFNMVDELVGAIGINIVILFFERPSLNQ